jgi:ABC-type transporter Mla subunit MlaD
MSETEKKIAALDELTVQADQLKSGIIAECQQVDETLNELLKTYEAAQGKNLDSTLNSFKSFLQSTNSTMSGMISDLRNVAGNATKIQLLFKQMSNDLA